MAEEMKLSIEWSRSGRLSIPNDVITQGELEQLLITIVEHRIDPVDGRFIVDFKFLYDSMKALTKEPRFCILPSDSKVIIQNVKTGTKKQTILNNLSRFGGISAIEKEKEEGNYLVEFLNRDNASHCINFFEENIAYFFGQSVLPTTADFYVEKVEEFGDAEDVVVPIILADETSAEAIHARESLKVQRKAEESERKRRIGFEKGLLRKKIELDFKNKLEIVNVGMLELIELSSDKRLRRSWEVLHADLIAGGIAEKNDEKSNSDDSDDYDSDDEPVKSKKSKSRYEEKLKSNRRR